VLNHSSRTCACSEHVDSVTDGFVHDSRGAKPKPDDPLDGKRISYAFLDPRIPGKERPMWVKESYVDIKAPDTGVTLVTRGGAATVSPPSGQQGST